jgi:hypothetical protein
VREVESHEVRLLFHAGDLHQSFAEVGLRLARRVGQRDEHLLAADLRRAYVVLHNRVTASISMLGAQPLEDPFGRVPLLARSLLVVFEDRVDHALPWAQFRPPHRLLPLIARWHRVLQHLVHRLARQTELPRRRPLAYPLHQHRPPYFRV